MMIMWVGKKVEGKNKVVVELVAEMDGNGNKNVELFNWLWTCHTMIETWFSGDK